MKNLSKRIGLILTICLLCVSFTACGKKDKVEEDVYKQQLEDVKDQQKDMIKNGKDAVKDAQKGTDEDKEQDKDQGKDEDKQSKGEVKQNEVFKVATLKGPTGMGMAKLMEQVENKESELKPEFMIMGSPEEIMGKVISGEVQFACVPTNLASILYNKTKGEVQLAAVNTLGVLYIVETGDTVNSIKDLKGKKISASGQNATPEYVLNYLLEQNKIDPKQDVEVDYKLQHSELAAAVAAGDVPIALLPQPHVTTVLMKNKDARIALNLTKEWEQLESNDSKLAMGCIIVNKKFAQDNKEIVDKFLAEYKSSIEWVNANHVEASKLIEKFNILPKAKIAEVALPNCNIVYVDSDEAKTTLEGFYKVLFKYNPKSLGGKLPDENFYYKK